MLIFLTSCLKRQSITLILALMTDEHPSTFQQFMEHCLGDFRNNFAVPYQDELLIFSKSFDKDLQHFQLILQRLKKHGIKIKPSKCKIFKTKVSYLGRLMFA